MNTALMSSETDLGQRHRTFDELDKEFHLPLTLVLLLRMQMQKVLHSKEDGLKQDWQGETVFATLHGKAIKNWVKKCYEESKSQIQK